ncbi:L-histidine N(alpha)-methyltransferase [Halopseudomonas salegens]|uniref:Dimethylhistidine N-methyltransferase n=1 Tax=Halopseudomonas salegens TaxID=1434072 RepID=A0A1H2G877_9GAMM|nr:L-histidine N(alpha)-methyltransferase [Halopseudomonas salegens]SDU15558.1 dimethylhistidine N-methyltransferase [Halopseudomonas salegens]
MSSTVIRAQAKPVAESIDGEFYRDVISGLRQRQKQLSPKYFYDALGSHYFDQICQLDEYYPYRTELNLLPDVAADLNDYFADRGAEGLNVVEFGAGSLHKIKPLLDGVAAIRRFTAIDISGAHLHNACALLAEHYPSLEIQPIEGDFTKPLELAPSAATPMGFFPGSTIGNLNPTSAIHFLASARKTLGDGSYMVLGVDTKKDEQVLNRAYNDREGVTARFNKNILTRINRELGADFEPDNFDHSAWYNRERGRVEMHLCSRSEQSVRLGKENFQFRIGESIHTENSYKYHPEEFQQLAAEAGWQAEKWWLAEDNLFSVVLLGNQGQVELTP